MKKPIAFATLLIIFGTCFAQDVRLLKHSFSANGFASQSTGKTMVSQTIGQPSLINAFTRGNIGYTYQWNSASTQDSTALQTGLLAQEVEEVFPELVKTEANGYKSINYIGLIPHLLEAIKELQKQNIHLKEKNAALEANTRSLTTDFAERLVRLEQILLSTTSSKKDKSID